MATSPASPINSANLTELASEVVDRQNHGVALLDFNGSILLWNEWMNDWTGIHYEQALYKTLANLFPPLIGSDFSKAIKKTTLEGLTQTWFLNSQPELLDGIESIFTRGDRSFPLSSVSLSPFIFASQRGCLIEFSESPFQPLQAQQCKQNTLLQQRALLATIYEGVADAIILLDAEGRVEHINPAGLELLDLRTTKVAGQLFDNFLSLVSGEKNLPINPHRETLIRGSFCQSPDSTFLQISGRSALQVVASATPLRDSQNHLSGCVLIIRMINQAAREAHKLAWHLDHDALTQLPNRHFLESALNRAIALAQTKAQQHVLLYLDLYNFSLVNDTCGKTAGDAMLKQCALLLKHAADEDTLVARIGNDEFAILLLNCSLDKAKAFASEIIATIKNFSFPWGERRLKVGISIGGEIVDRESSSEIDALVAAAFSCAAARESGRNRAFFQYQRDNLYQRRQIAEWVPRITDALDHDNFCLHYQSITPARPVEHGYRHYEALIRMVDNNGELILPGKFIPTAELHGLIDDIDRWVIRQAITDIMSLDARQRHDLRISINLSGPTISDEHFKAYLIETIEETGVDPHHLQFEITETAAIREFDRALDLIHTLKARGCYFSLDDFGTGLSSLGYLKQIPVDYLKIDGSFIHNIELNDVDFSMVSTINHLAHVMGIATIAECVENPIQLAMLQEIGVDCVQGFFIDKPRPMKDIMI